MKCRKSKRGVIMNTHKLKTFCTVVEHDSFSKASEKLFCSQPAISKQIRSLENELGYPLLVLNHRRPKHGLLS